MIDKGKIALFYDFYLGLSCANILIAACRVGITPKVHVDATFYKIAP